MPKMYLKEKLRQIKTMDSEHKIKEVVISKVECVGKAWISKAASIKFLAPNIGANSWGPRMNLYHYFSFFNRKNTIWNLDNINEARDVDNRWKWEPLVFFYHFSYWDKMCNIIAKDYEARGEEGPIVFPVRCSPCEQKIPALASNPPAAICLSESMIRDWWIN